MNLAPDRVRLCSVNQSIMPEGEDSVVGQLSPGWWIRGLARHDRVSRPAWADIAEAAVAAAAVPGVLPVMDSWQVAFAIPFRPFLTATRDRLAGAAQRHLPPEHADSAALADTFTAGLARQLARIALRTLLAELDTARAAGRLTGSDGQQRFADFVRQQCAPAGLAALFEAYPVLARLLGTASQLAAQAGLELLTRLAADREAMVGTLLGGVDPGPAVAIEPGLGDLHRKGRSVAAVSFADGRKVVYKPRSLQAHLRLGQVIDWLNERVPRADLRTPAVVARPGYGWQEFITSRALTRPGAAEDFYWREGVLLAALHALRAVDVHCENLIADRDQPVLVDVEALFHPILPFAHATGADPAAQGLAASVHRIALLPRIVVEENGVLDRSGMGGDPGEHCGEEVLDWDPPASDQARLIRRVVPFPGAGNRPRSNGEAAEPGDYETAVLGGFRLGYDAVVRDRQAFARLVESCGDAEVRIVFRPTSGYARLLDESTHPAMLRDARDRDEALDVLDVASAGHPLWHQLVQYELADLWSGDIPLLTGRPAARDVWTSAGQRVPGLLDRSGLSCALDQVTALGEVDRLDQEWVISASLATRRPAGGHHSTQSMPGPLTATAAEPSRLLAVACGLADQIVARGMTGGEGTGQHRVNWLGLQLVDDTRWMVLPMGASLADGYLGVALFLAQLAGLTGVGRYAEVALLAVSQVPQLCGMLAGRPDLLAAVGCGGTDGLGGICYGLGRMATLLDDAELRGWAEAVVELTAAAADQPAPPGWAAGSAGCLAAMTAVRQEVGSAAAAAVAAACAEQLTELVERTDGRCALGADPVPPGFAAGPAGIGWALTRFAAAGADQSYSRAGHRAVLAARAGAAGRTTSPGWCRGTAGVLAAVTCLADDRGTAELPSSLRILDGQPVLGDLSLCHGDLGIAEALTVLAAADHGGAASRACRHRAGLILDALRRHDRYCGTPGGVPTPGLLNGLAGIGYGLLRLGFAEQVPSVLLLEPTPPPSAQQPRPA